MSLYEAWPGPHGGRDSWALAELAAELSLDTLPSPQTWGTRQEPGPAQTMGWVHIGNCAATRTGEGSLRLHDIGVAIVDLCNGKSELSRYEKGLLGIDSNAAQDVWGATAPFSPSDVAANTNAVHTLRKDFVRGMATMPIDPVKGGMLEQPIVDYTDSTNPLLAAISKVLDPTELIGIVGLRHHRIKAIGGVAVL